MLSARSDPLLPLHRYRLAGQMVELRAGDLAMTKAEAHALLTAHGVTLRGPELALLTRRTEGWAAGLRLSAMSLAGSRNPEQFVTQLALDQGSVGEYLIEEVLNRQPERVRRLLIQSSFLDDVSGSLAAAVTGIDDSAELLAELARTNSFVLADRDRPDHYRYHQLFEEILRHLLRREYGDQLAELRSRAAAWYEARDETAAAMRFAVQAGDLAPRGVGAGPRWLRPGVRRATGPDRPRAGRPARPTGRPRRRTGLTPANKVSQAAVAVLTGQLDLARVRWPRPGPPARAPTSRPPHCWSRSLPRNARTRTDAARPRRSRAARGRAGRTRPGHPGSAGRRRS